MSTTYAVEKVEGLEKFCRGCLIRYDEPNDLIQYTEKTRRQFIYATGLQVKRNDAFTFQLCKDCYINIKMTCKFKKQCRTSDKIVKNYLALKDAGETADFCSFLKKSDDTFRFPFLTSYSTPMQQKYKDDDNESTTTSIRNFMTDMLKSDKIPDTEANIIREAIEEEADILDDSLDSQWLQEDMSIDADFNLDFSPFATPRSVLNDTCHSTKKDAHHVYAPISFSPFKTPRSAKEESCSPHRQDKQHVYVALNKIVHTNKKNTTEDLVLDSIDKNLEKALKKEEDLIALDDLLISPATATPQAATPTVDNIIGKTLNYNDDSQSDAQPKVGHCIEMFNNVRGADDLDVLFIGAKINFYGSGKEITKNEDAEFNETVPNDSAEDKIKLPEVEPHDDIKTDRSVLLPHLLPKDEPDNDTYTDQSVPIPFQRPKLEPHDGNTGQPAMSFEVTQVEIYDELTKEVFLPTCNGDISSNTDKFKPAVEIISSNSGEENVDEAIQSANKEPMTAERKCDKFYCNICELDTVNYGETLHHYETVHKVVIKEKLKVTRLCNVCGKTFSNNNFYYHHMKIHKGDKDWGTFSCDICKLTFTTKSKIVVHMKVHMLKQVGLKKQQKEPSLDARSKKLTCTICNAVMVNNSNLKVHMRRHTNDFIAFCETCKKGFVRKQDLSLHMRTHTAEKPYDCTECGKKFARPDTRNLHLRTVHTGEKPYECEFCHAKFARSNFLSRHVRDNEKCHRIRASGVSRVECQFCHATFAYQLKLTAHMRTNKKCMLIQKGGVIPTKRKYKKKKRRSSD